MLRTVQLGPPGPDGVQRGGPLRPPDRQLFRVKVRSVGSWGVWGGVVVGMGLREGVKGRFGANGLSSCQFTGMSAPTTGKFVLCFNCIAFVNVFLCWFCQLPSCHDFSCHFLDPLLIWQLVEQITPLCPLSPLTGAVCLQVHGTDEGGAPLQRETSAISAVSIGPSHSPALTLSVSHTVLHIYPSSYLLASLLHPSHISHKAYLTYPLSDTSLTLFHTFPDHVSHYASSLSLISYHVLHLSHTMSHTLPPISSFILTPHTPSSPLHFTGRRHLSRSSPLTFLTPAPNMGPVFILITGSRDDRDTDGGLCRGRVTRHVTVAAFFCKWGSPAWHPAPIDPADGTAAGRDTG